MKIALAILVSALVSTGHVSFRETAFPVLQRLNEIVVSFQNTDPADSEYGGITCPGENLYHTRAAEAMFPLACEYSLAGNAERLGQALKLADWLMKYQRADGSWRETPEEWTGTTADQLLMMLLTYPLVRDRLDEDSRLKWLACMRAASDYLARVMDNRFASINYCATTAAALSEACLVLGSASYLDKARSLAEMTVSKMNFDRFIEGEGEREGTYKYGVDLGYNFEMSLWGLARYAEIAGDEEMMETLFLSAKTLFSFVYPDGMLEASSGIRSNKWTIYGSGTSDGIHPLCAIMSRFDPVFLAVSVRNLRRMQDCFSSCGLLAQGPDYDAVRDTPPCIYPSFAKAKSLALALSWLRDDPCVPDRIPSDGDFDAFYQSIGTVVARRGAFCATVAAYNYKAKSGATSKYMHRPAGGAMSALWIEGFGLLGASSQTEYHRWEPMSFPQMPPVRPLTPRLELADGNTLYTNLYDFDAVMSCRPDAGKYRCTVLGELKDRDQKRSGARYKADYTISGRSLVKHYEIRQGTSSGEVVAVEPIVYDESLSIRRISDSEILLGRGDVEVSVSVDNGASIVPDYGSMPEYRQVFPSLRALPLLVRFDGYVNLKIEITQ